MLTTDQNVEEQAQRYLDIRKVLGNLSVDSPEFQQLVNEATAIMQNLDSHLSRRRLEQLFGSLNTRS